MLRHLTALTVLGLGLVSTNASAQCLTGPDGLTGACWQQAGLNLPNFPNIGWDSVGLCWTDCTPNPPICTKTSVAAPTPTVCGQYTALYTVSDCTGAALLSGALIMDYTRTWEEFNPGTPGDRYQVYRFAVKVDMRMAGTVAPPCIVPPCIFTFQRAFYYGYMDYAFNCTTGVWEGALVLFHNCDGFIHHPTKSSTPGVFHPDTNYALVAPVTTLNPFSPIPLTPPSGGLVAEAVRNVPSSPVFPCTSEDLISSGSMTILAQGCGCPLQPTPPQLTARRLLGRTSCVIPGTTMASEFYSADVTPTFPWYHMMTTSIGTWTTTVGYPGEEACWVDEVPMLYRDSCSAAAGLSYGYGEVFYGGSTDGGYAVVPTPVGILTQKFLDLAGNKSWALPGGPGPIFMGHVMPTRHLIYTNVP